MNIANLKREDKDIYDKRFQSFLAKMIDVAKYHPKEKYLYPIMDGVPFRDMEVALDFAVQLRTTSKANDNAQIL